MVALKPLTNVSLLYSKISFGSFRSVPNADSSKTAPSKQHANVNRSSLDGDSYRDKDTHQLHETDSPQFVSDEDLQYRSTGFAGDIYCYNLQSMSISGQLCRRVKIVNTYSTSETIRRMVHVCKKTWMSNRYSICETFRIGAVCNILTRSNDASIKSLLSISIKTKL